MSSQITVAAPEPARAPAPAQRPAADVVSTALRVAGQEPLQPPPAKEPAAQQRLSPEDAVEMRVEQEQLTEAVETVTEAVSERRRELQFSVASDGGRTIITVVDSDTGEVIRQIPPEEMVRIAQTVSSGEVSLIERSA